MRASVPYAAIRAAIGGTAVAAAEVVHNWSHRAARRRDRKC